MKCNLWLHLDREYNIYFKEDHRMSVTLNPPNKKPKDAEDIDYWEPNYPYTTKKISYDDNRGISETVEPRDGFETHLDLHHRSGFAQKRNNEGGNQPDTEAYIPFEDEAEVAPDEEHVPDHKND